MKLSVVIPAYNEELLIGACLRSITEQTRPADEIIVIDNNSTDNTTAIAQTYGATVATESQQGIWAASRTGYDTATGDIIVRCDADSVMPKDWLARIEQHFRNDIHLTAVTGPGTFYGAPRTICRLADVLYMRAYFLSVGAALGHPPLFGSNMAIRKTAWLQARATAHHAREDIHDDIDLSYHLPFGSSVTYDRSLIVGISARPLKDPAGMLRRYKKGMKSIVIHWPDKAPWNTRRKR